MTMLRLGSLLLVLGCSIPSAAGGQRVTDSARAPVATGPARIIYASDWSGTSQIYAVDPSGRQPTGQLTFGRAPACVPDAPCGFTTPTPSPDGRRILFSDYGGQGASESTLYVSSADGRSRRRLGALRRFALEAVWAPDSRRIAYTGKDGIRLVNADGSGASRVRLNANDRSPAWSGDGRALAFIHFTGTPATETLHVVRRGVVTKIASSDRSALSFRWSPVGDRLAYTTSEGLYVIGWNAPSGPGLAARVYGYAWSPDGKRLAFVDDEGMKLATVAQRSVRQVAANPASELAWSPDSKLLAYTVSDRRIRVVAVATGAIRDLGQSGGAPAWSPDGQSLAYSVSSSARTDLGVSDIRVTTLSGSTRTVVAGAGTFGGAIRGFAWTRPPTTLRYRQPVSRSLATIAPDRLEAPWPIERIASDGSRVAYTACGHIFVWTPSAGEVVQREATASLSPACGSAAYYTSYRVYSLALAGDRVAYGTVSGGIGRVWWLGGTRGAGGETFTLGEGRSTTGLAYNGDIVGELAGSGNLLAFSLWQEELRPDRVSAVTTAQEVRRAAPTGCPCPVIASSPGPLVLFDADGGRVVAGGDNATWLVDEAGTRLLAIPFSPRGAQLSGRDLVVVRRAELHHYDAATGALLHAWPLPDVAPAADCGSPNGSRCDRGPSQLVLQDLARGLVTYALNGQVHLLRLADGAGAVVASGTLARFLDDGLVYVDGARLQLVPWDRLPLR